MEPSTNPKAIASLVLGILSLGCGLVGWFPIPIGTVIGIVIGIIGLVLGIVADKEAKSGIGIAGIVLNAVGLGLCVISLIACAACVSYLGEAARALNHRHG